MTPMFLPDDLVLIQGSTWKRSDGQVRDRHGKVRRVSKDGQRALVAVASWARSTTLRPGHWAYRNHWFALDQLKHWTA